MPDTASQLTAAPFRAPYVVLTVLPTTTVPTSLGAALNVAADSSSDTSSMTPASTETPGAVIAPPAAIVMAATASVSALRSHVVWLPAFSKRSEYFPTGTRTEYVPSAALVAVPAWT